VLRNDHFQCIRILIVLLVIEPWVFTHTLSQSSFSLACPRASSRAQVRRPRRYAVTSSPAAPPSRSSAAPKQGGRAGGVAICVARSCGCCVGCIELTNRLDRQGELLLSTSLFVSSNSASSLSASNISTGIWNCGTRDVTVWLPISIFIMNSEFAGGELILIDLR
jgi:hypothetical protein